MKVEETVKKKMSKKHQGRTVSQLRNAVELKQVDFGEIFGWTQSKVSDIESMEVIPEADLKPIAEFFDVPVTFFDRFNFKDAIDSFVSSPYFDAKDTSNNAANTAGIIEEINYNQDFSKLHELYEARINDAKRLGELEEKIRNYEANCDCNKKSNKK